MLEIAQRFALQILYRWYVTFLNYFCLSETKSQTPWHFIHLSVFSCRRVLRCVSALLYSPPSIDSPWPHKLSPLRFFKTQTKFQTPWHFVDLSVFSCRRGSSSPSVLVHPLHHHHHLPRLHTPFPLRNCVPLWIIFIRHHLCRSLPNFVPIVRMYDCSMNVAVNNVTARNKATVTKSTDNYLN